MAGYLDGNTIILSGDGLSFSSFKKQLPDAPTGADSMFFYYKTWFDIDSNSNIFFAGNGWDSASCFGLSFFPTIPINDPSSSRQASGFLGYIANNFASYTSQTDFYKFPSFSLGLFGSAIGDDGSTNLESASDRESTLFSSIFENLDGWQSSFSTSALPRTQNSGIITSICWNFNKDESDSQKIFSKIGINFESLDVENIETMRTSSNTFWSDSVNIDATGSFRSGEDGNMYFPKYIMGKYGGFSGNFVLSGYKIEYYKYAD